MSSRRSRRISEKQTDDLTKATEPVQSEAPKKKARKVEITTTTTLPRKRGRPPRSKEPTVVGEQTDLTKPTRAITIKKKEKKAIQSSVEAPKRRGRPPLKKRAPKKIPATIEKKKRSYKQRVEIVVEESGSSEEDLESQSEHESESDSKSKDDSETEEEESEPEDESEEELDRKKNKSAAKRKPGRPPLKKKPTLDPKRTIRRVNQTATVMPLRQVSQTLTSVSGDAYALARERLHVSAVPDSLPCREDEFMEISGYLESAIEECTGTCIYISGVPGTGKTATVHEVIRHLQHQSEENKLPVFDFVEINGMKLTDPNQAYSILWECMSQSSENDRPRKCTATHALQLLEEKFSEPNDDQKITVVLMDELDLLVTKKQTVMYNFFDWPSKPLSKLIVVAIANTMDLPERLMSNKVASRIGLTRINFQPYRYDQLIQIVQSRLEGIDAFSKEAVEFAARKVSAVSGDARRALDICRRAVEIVEQKFMTSGSPSSEKKMQVTIAIIDGAIKEMFTSPYVSFIRSCSLHQKIFLVSCMQVTRSTGLGEIEFGDICHHHTQTCKWHNIEPPNVSDMMRVLESLGQCRALVVEGGKMDIHMRISLNLMEQDIIMACKDDKLVSKLLQSLPSTNL